MSAECLSADLTVKQFRALNLLTAGGAPDEVAHQIGVTPRTLRNWMSRPDFQQALAEARSQMLQETWTQLAQAAYTAIWTLKQISEDPYQKASVRVAAAGKILGLLFRNAPQLTGALSEVPGLAEAPTVQSAAEPPVVDSLTADPPAADPPAVDQSSSVDAAVLSLDPAASPVATEAELDLPELAPTGPRPPRIAAPGGRRSRPFRELSSDDWHGDRGLVGALTLELPAALTR